MTADPSGWRRLTEAGANLTAYLDLDDVLRRALPYAADCAGAEGGSLMLHDAETHELVVAAASGPAGYQMRGQRFPEDAGTAGAVLRSGQPCIVPGPERDTTRRAPIDRVCGEEVRSLMAAPLKIGTRTLGVVLAVNRIGGRAFEAADLDRFAAFCGLIAVAVENASLHRLLDKETEIFRRSREDQARPLIAASPAMRQALAQAERAAGGKSTILLVGETGSGKEQLARRIHEASPRAAGPFVALNCGALPEGLLESELFGHERGAFTGADRRRIGRFELADGGTLFLDEIGELPPAAQVKLLRVLQEHEITRVGGGEPLRVNVRLVAATHRDLAAEVRAGRFREDLFFRIHVVPVHLPSLRDRPEDIEPLTLLFLDRLARELGRAPRGISEDALERLRCHRWPGNVRELENLVERLVVLGREGPIDKGEVAELLPEIDPKASQTLGPGAHGSAGLSLWEQEHHLLVQALERVGHNQTQAARLLGISREQLRTRMKRYGLLQKP